jgi:hypothetical protein
VAEAFVCATFAMDFFQGGIGSQFDALLGGHFASPVALNAAIVLLSIASTMVFLVPAARDKLTKAQAKVEHKRLTIEIERHGRAYYQDDAPKISAAEYEALRLRVNTHRGAVSGICPGIGFPLCRALRTQVGHRAMSEKCHNRTHAPQQTASHLAD